LLDEFPSARKRVTRILAASQWAADFLRKHPLLLDELLDERSLYAPPDWDAYESELRTALNNAWLPDKITPDIERRMDLSREIHHAQLFRLLAQDLEGMWSVERISDHISALADRTLKVVLEQAWLQVANRHRPDPQFAIIAYGKLGGKELGYGSDLDIVFVYEDAHERAGEIYASYVRKLINWLTVKTGEGDLFEIDTALRPNGNSGLLVSTFEAYADYQCQRGENTAWTWEHQAMTRARFCLGAPALQTRFDAVRANVINAKRDQTSLRQEIVAMRDKLRAAHTVKPDLFDVKHSAGGMVDVEFAVQYLVLAHAQRHPALLANVGNIALLLSAEKAGLLPAGVGEAAGSAYRELRRVQHRARLDEQPTQVPTAVLEKECAAIQALWHAVFG